jgi:O-antigen/teichoic acid export membrane protein
MKYKPTERNDYFSTDHLVSSIKVRALRGAKVTLIAQLFTYLIGTVGVIILARLLTPHDFGLVTMVLSISMLFQNLGPNGFIDATVQRKQLDAKQVSTMFWINVGLNLALTFFFSASAPIIASLYNEPEVKPIVVAMSVTILLGCLGTQHQGLLLRNMQYLRYCACDFWAVLVSSVAAILLAYWGWGYWAIVAKWVVSPLVTSLIAWMLCGWRPGFPTRDAEVGPMLRFAFNTYGNFVMSYFRRTIDKILIGRFCGSQSLGNYDRAYSLAGVLPNQIVSPLNSVAISTFSRLASDTRKYHDTYLGAVSALAFVSMPLSAALTLAGKDIILILLGPQWSEAGTIFSLLGVSTGVGMLYTTHSWMHLSLGTTDRWLRWGFVAFIVTVLCVLAGLPFGARGVAIGISASFYILIGPGLWYAGRPINLRLSSVFSVLWKYFVSALVSGVSCWCLLYVYPSTQSFVARWHVLVRIPVSMALCICVYCVSVVILYQGIEPLTKIIRVLREILSKDFFTPIE